MSDTCNEPMRHIEGLPDRRCNEPLGHGGEHTWWLTGHQFDGPDFERAKRVIAKMLADPDVQAWAKEMARR